MKFPRPTHPYVPTAAGFLYLAVVLDTFSRRIVGWAMETHLRTELVLAALEMAIGQPQAEQCHPPQRPGHPVYIAGVRQPLSGSRRAHPMGSVGDAYDNAM